MHGQKRAEYKARLTNPVTAAKLEKKALQWNTLFQELLSRRSDDSTKTSSILSPELEVPKMSNISSKDTSKESAKQDAKSQNSLMTTLALNSKLVTVNPDPLLLWNMRREILGQEEKLFDLDTELNVTKQCLERNPKAYGIWLHRKWTLCYFLSVLVPSFSEQVKNGKEAPDPMKILEYELHLCKLFLDLDERNFHCWNYRRFVVSTMGKVAQEKKLKIYIQTA